MSKSILDLLGSMNSPKGVQQPTPEDELYNPEVPDSSLAGTINSKAIIQDQYYNKMRLAKTRKNGDGYAIGNGHQQHFSISDENWYQDNSIDPNEIRKKSIMYGVNNSSLPTSFINGGINDSYVLPNEAYKKTNDVGPLKKSIKSYINYVNRYN